MTMSGIKHSSGATANGFRPRTLLKAAALNDNHYHTPPNMRALGGWALSINGIRVPNSVTPMNRDWRGVVLPHY